MFGGQWKVLMFGDQWNKKQKHLFTSSHFPHEILLKLSFLLKPFVKIIMKLKTHLFSHGLQFTTLDTIVDYMIRFVDYFLIIRQTT
jgi:hypothetical protein